MPTATFNVGPANLSDAGFRAWGSALSAALGTVGLVKTSDTGQINWATVLTPAAVNTQQGFEVWRFSDTLQATAPIFIRIGYGSGSASTSPAIWFTLGKGSDGAGNITGTIIAAQQVAANAAAATGTASPWYVSGDGSSLLFATTSPAFNVNNWYLLIERSRDTAGAASAVGGLTVWGIAAAPVIRTWNYAGASVVTLPKWPAQPPANTTLDVSLAVGGKAPLFPAVFNDGLGNLWQPRSVLTGMRSDTGAGSAITVPVFGTYLALGAAAQGFDGAAGAYAAAAIRWQ